MSSTLTAHTKKCPRCQAKKPATLDFFYKSSRRPDGLKPYCKACEIQQASGWRIANRERVRTNARKSWAARKHLYVKRRRQWDLANPDKIREHRRRTTEKRKGDPKHKLCARMRVSLNKAIKDKGGRSWEALVGYTAERLILHLERQFSAGMTWDNIGEWHIDHIVPISAFAFQTSVDPDFRACWALTNLTPRWAADNLAKSNSREFLI